MDNRDKFAEKLLNWRWPLTALLIGFIAVLLMRMPDGLGFQADFRIFFDDDDPLLLAYEDMEQEFNRSYTLLFLVEAQQGDLLTAERLQVLKSLTDRAWRMEDVLRVTSLANYQYTRAEGDELWVRDLIDDPAAADQAELARLRGVLQREADIHKRLISDDFTSSPVLVFLDLDANQDKEKRLLMAEARLIAAEISAADPGLKVRLSGQMAMDVTVTEIAELDAANIESAMFLLQMLLLMVFLRSVVATVAALAVIIVSALSAIGFLSAVYGEFNGINLSAPYIALMLGTLDAVHLLSGYCSALSEGRDKRSAMLASLSKNLEALFMTSVTTAAGFLAMNFSEAPPFREFGNATAFGVMVAFVASVTVLPALMLLLPAPRKPKAPVTTLVAWVDGFFTRHQRRFVPAGFLLLLVMIPAALLNSIENDPLGPFAESEPVRQAAEFSEQKLAGYNYLDFMLDSGSSGNIVDSDFLLQADQFLDWLQDQPEVIAVNGLPRVIKRLNRNMQGDAEAQYRIPEQRRTIAELLLIYESSVPEEVDLQDSLNIDRSAIKVTAHLKSLPNTQMLAFSERALHQLSQYPALEGSASSPALMYAKSGYANIVSMLKGCLYLAAFVCVAMMLMFRSVKLGLLCMLPNLMPALVAFGLCGLFVGEIDMGAAMVFSMTLGVVVDDTIHFVVCYRRMRSDGLDPERAVSASFSLVGRALLVTSLMLCLSFLVPIFFAQLQINVLMYSLIVVCIAVALITDMLFLPALLLKMEKR